MRCLLILSNLLWISVWSSSINYLFPLWQSDNVLQTSVWRSSLYFYNLNDSTVKTALEIGKYTDAEQIEGKEMARDQLFELQMCCMGWAFLIQCCSFGRYSGKVVILSSFSVKSCGYCSALYMKARFSYRNKSLLSWCRPDVGPVRNHLPCFALKRKTTACGHTSWCISEHLGDLFVLGLKSSFCSWFLIRIL